MRPSSSLTTVSVDPAEAARLGRHSLLTSHAVALATWVGCAGRPVTAGRALRRVDVAPAGSVLGVPVPLRVRAATDVPALRRPWSFAVGAGLIEIGKSVATAGPMLERWPTLDDTALLAAWRAGANAVCEAESEPRSPQSVAVLMSAFLEAVATRDGMGQDGKHPDNQNPDCLWQPVMGIVERWREDGDVPGRVPLHALTRYLDVDTRDSFAGLVELLGQLGVVTGEDSATVALTPLGRWCEAMARADRPRTITVDLPAGEVVEALADRVRQGMDPWTAVRRWLEYRQPAEAAQELLTAAAGLSAAARIAAGKVADGLGGQASGVWRTVARHPNLGAHARAHRAVAGDAVALPVPADARWLAVEFASAALEGPGPDEALTVVFDRLPGEDLDARLVEAAATGHPDAARVVAAVREFVASGAIPSIDQVYQLKVGLARCQPPIWRRVLVPTTITLGDLHAVVQVLFGWDGDHLHLFEVGARRYSDPFFDLDALEMGDESAVRLRQAFSGTTTRIRYEYDLGASWWHEITLERTVRREPDTAYPLCTGFASDSPVEYWSEADPQESEPFDLAETNRSLAGWEAGSSGPIGESPCPTQTLTWVD